MKDYFEQTIKSIEVEIESISMDSCDIATEESFRMVHLLQNALDGLRTKFIECDVSDTQEEIIFFKEIKPQVLSKLLYFNKIYTIELKRPNGSNISQKSYYDNELDSLTYFFNRNLDFYQYYRSGSTHLDECYFIRGKPNIRLCVDSSQFISDLCFQQGMIIKLLRFYQMKCFVFI